MDRVEAPADGGVKPAPRSFRQRAVRFVARRVVSYSLIYICVVIVFASLELSLVFQPSSPAQSWVDPVDPRTQDAWLTDARGTKLHAWWIPPKRVEQGAILVAHGNGGNVSHRGLLASDLNRAVGAGVLLFEYPGYGKSEGRPTEEGCYDAGDAGYRWLVEEAKIPPNRVVLFGESLGGGVAVEMAVRHEHRALVLLYTFTSLPAAAKYHYPWLPTHMLMRTRFDSLSKVGKCTRPVFIAHGTADEIVPFRQGEQLFAAANEPKEFVRLEGMTHNIAIGEAFYAPLARFLETQAP